MTYPSRTVWRMRGYSLLVVPVLILLELTPLPVAAVFLLYVMLWRPAWFRRYVDNLYLTKSP